MQFINKKTDYALRALAALAVRKDRFTDAREISDTEDIPYQFVRSILSKLRRAGYAESKEGADGGFKLKDGHGEITAAEIIRLFQGDIQLASCMFRKRICANRKKCILRSKIKKIEEMIISEFEAITIRDLAGTRSQGGDSETKDNKDR